MPIFHEMRGFPLKRRLLTQLRVISRFLILTIPFYNHFCHDTSLSQLPSSISPPWTQFPCGLLLHVSISPHRVEMSRHYQCVAEDYKSWDSWKLTECAPPFLSFCSPALFKSTCTCICLAKHWCHSNSVWSVNDWHIYCNFIVGSYHCKTCNKLLFNLEKKICSIFHSHDLGAEWMLVFLFADDTKLYLDT